MNYSHAAVSAASSRASVDPSVRQPLMTAIGRSFTVFFEMPAAWQVSTTCPKERKRG